MPSSVERRPEAVRRVRELIFAVLAVWLIVQNVLLLSLVPWSTVTSVGVVVGALIKVARAVSAEWAVVALAVLAGLTVVAALVRDGERRLEPVRVEARHG